MHFLILLFSFAVLLYSSDVLVDLAVKIASRFRISTMAIGLTVVAIGTSLPEVATSAVASFEGHSEIALGNVVGSNICNLALIFGIPAIIYPIVSERKVLLKDGGIMLLVSFMLWGLAYVNSHQLGRMTGVLFLLFFAMYIYHSLSSVVDTDNLAVSESNESNLWLIFKLVVSLVLVLASSKYLVDAAAEFASQLGVSKNVIAITLIAFGTSIPELSVSIAAARKKQSEILVGNIIGSNIANMLLVLGVASIVKPITANKIAISLDIPIMISISIVSLLFLFNKNGITRSKGIFLLFCYVLVIWRCVVLPL